MTTRPHPNRKTLQDQHPDTPLLFADGFDDAIVGVVHVFTREGRTLRVLYDYDAMIRVLRLETPDAPMDEILEHLEVNVLGAYVGPDTPAYAVLHDPFVARILGLRDP